MFHNQQNILIFAIKRNSKFFIKYEEILKYSNKSLVYWIRHKKGT